jgi:hypothetical protein
MRLIEIRHELDRLENQVAGETGYIDGVLRRLFMLAALSLEALEIALEKKSDG